MQVVSDRFVENLPSCGRMIFFKENGEESPFRCVGACLVLCKRLHPQGPKSTTSSSGVAVISEYCKGNSSAVEYLLGLKFIGLHIEDVSFATDQTERHLEVGNTGYGNYDSSAKRRLLVSLGIFLRIYYKEDMFGEQLASLPSTSVLTEGSLWASHVH
ncbi:hypothetical protein Adt_01133 [Abeliophyllum distichum]|uniref:Uncharacterized protein n=1 Tax=Abeliophyllum distichum TaxID=126358 RepID=A0ABD1VV38_9LAMI